jgi:hypothetical protein
MAPSLPIAGASIADDVAIEEHIESVLVKA